jgi:hypothetical protein
MLSTTSENETRIIAISNVNTAAAEMFSGLTVNAAGYVRVGSTDIHPQELGPALAQVVIVFNDYLEKQGLSDPSKDRAIIYGTTNTEPEEDLTDAEKLGSWLYSSPDLLDLRIKILEQVVKIMRDQHPIYTE